jgi:hypothetical protein
VADKVLSKNSFLPTSALKLSPGVRAYIARGAVAAADVEVLASAGRAQADEKSASATAAMQPPVTFVFALLVISIGRGATKENARGCRSTAAAGIRSVTTA